MKENKIFILFANCKVVNGAKRSIICDLQRGSFDFIPNGLMQILTEHNGKSLKEIKAFYDNACDTTIDEYFEFLTSKEYGFWGEDEDRILFPDLDLTWCSSSIITNSIIDVGENSSHDFEKIFSELEELGCRDVQIRFYCTKNKSQIENIISLLDFSRIKSIELVIKNSNNLSFADMEHLTAEYPRIRNIIIHSAPEFRLAKINKVNWRGNIIYISEIITSSSHCGIIDPSNFVINLPTYMESLKYNSCLNGKISIDVSGNIKNCPSMNKSFGQIGKDSLKEISLNDDFKRLWNISKDQISVCKDCEFRHICTDCRAFLEIPNDIYSKPQKCGYNPYTAQWTS